MPDWVKEFGPWASFSAVVVWMAFATIERIVAHKKSGKQGDADDPPEPSIMMKSIARNIETMKDKVENTAVNVAISGQKLDHVQREISKVHEDSAEIWRRLDIHDGRIRAVEIESARRRDG